MRTDKPACVFPRLPRLCSQVSLFFGIALWSFLVVSASAQSNKTCRIRGLASASSAPPIVEGLAYFQISGDTREAVLYPFGHDADKERRAIVVGSAGAELESGKTSIGVVGSVLANVSSSKNFRLGTVPESTFFLPHDGRFIVGEWARIDSDNFFRSALITLLGEDGDFQEVWAIGPGGKPKKVNVNDSPISPIGDKPVARLNVTGMVGWESDQFRGVRLAGSFSLNGIDRKHSGNRKDRLISFDGESWVLDDFSKLPISDEFRGKKGQRRRITGIRLARSGDTCRAIGIMPCFRGDDFIFVHDWVGDTKPVIIERAVFGDGPILSRGILTPSAANPIQTGGVDHFSLMLFTKDGKSGRLHGVGSKRVGRFNLGANQSKLHVDEGLQGAMDEMDWSQLNINSVVAPYRGRGKGMAGFAFVYHFLESSTISISYDDQGKAVLGEPIALGMRAQFSGAHSVMIGNCASGTHALVAPNVSFGLDVSLPSKEPFTVIYLDSSGVPNGGDKLPWTTCFAESAQVFGDID
ncbi:MAG: hypothetical protein GY930_18610 [bacterium]|nr:hypothetical protein [bacterium]